MVDLERRLDEVELLGFAGTEPERLAALEKLLAEARGMGHEPSIARALHRLAQAEQPGKNPTERLREVIEIASRLKDDRLVVLAWADLGQALVEFEGKIDEAAALEPAMKAAGSRAGWPPSATYAVASTIGVRAARAGDLPLAISEFERALTAAVRPVERQVALSQLATGHFLAGQNAEAMRASEKHVDIAREIYGAGHPQTAAAMVQLSKIANRAGDFERQEKLLREAIEILTRGLGEEHYTVAGAIHSLGNLERIRGNHKEAEALLRRAVAIYEKSDERVGLASAVTALADAIAVGSGLDGAKEYYVRGLELLEQYGGGKDSLEYVMAESNYAARLVNARLCDEARPLLDHGTLVLEKRGHPGVTISLGNSAKCDFIEGNPEKAFATFEQIISKCRRDACPPRVLEGVLATYGGQLSASSRTRAKGVAMLREARAGLERMGLKGDLASVDKLLREAGAKP